MEILPSLKQEILHPYTKALLAAALGFNPRNRTQNRILFREEELPIEPGRVCILSSLSLCL